MIAGSAEAMRLVHHDHPPTRKGLPGCLQRHGDLGRMMTVIIYQTRSPPRPAHITKIREATADTSKFCQALLDSGLVDAELETESCSARGILRIVKPRHSYRQRECLFSALTHQIEMTPQTLGSIIF